MLKISFLAAAVALGVAASASTFAQAQDATVLQRHVSYADLDLASPAGIAAFNRRIEIAIVQVCPAPDGHDLHAWRLTLECRDNARNQVEPARKALLAAAAQRAGKSVVLAAK